MWTALLLAVCAGLSTTIGSLLGVVVKRPGPGFTAFTLGFSAGVMLLVSFVELLGNAMQIEGVGFVGAHVAFFSGMLSYFLLDYFVPHSYIGQNDYPQAKYGQTGGPSPQALQRTGALVAVGIAIHNFPEGMVTYVSALNDFQVGLAIAVAIAIHNIPEGLAIAAPIYAGTGSRKKAFLWSFYSGISEVLGAVLAALFLTPLLTDAMLGFVLAAVAGIMVVISLDELIPIAKSYNTEHIPILGVVSGMVVMMISLWQLS